MAKDKVDVQITMTARLNGVDTVDVAPLGKQSPGDLLGTLLRQGVKVEVRVSEIYEKPVKGGM